MEYMFEHFMLSYYLTALCKRGVAKWPSRGNSFCLITYIDLILLIVNVLCLKL